MYYFAYASNLNRGQMAARCPGSVPKFAAVLPNFKLIFTGWSREWGGGVASIRRYQGGKVKGAVYEVSDRDLRSLDRHEGYPSVCNRVNVLVFTDDGDSVEAVTYVRREQSQEAPPSKKYLALIAQGYRDWGITV
ncbi:MAG: gamma-glutamylcyclotransferase family protein [Chloroflexota bacterium]|nr:gamma-glutamylcyclotransferase family protein [Chloroflexota bacterium]